MQVTEILLRRNLIAGHELKLDLWLVYLDSRILVWTPTVQFCIHTSSLRIIVSFPTAAQDRSSCSPLSRALSHKVKISLSPHTDRSVGFESVVPPHGLEVSFDLLVSFLLLLSLLGLLKDKKIVGQLAEHDHVSRPI